MASLEALPNGTFRVVWRQDGVKQRERFASRADAEDFLARVQLDDNHWPRGWIPRHGFIDEIPELHAPTFRDWCKRSIDARATANERTRADYHRQAELHLHPTFGSKPLDQISREDVGRWLVEMQRGGRSQKTIRNVHNLASTVMKDAVEQRHAPANPFHGAMRAIPTVKQEQMETLTRQEAETLLRVTPERWRPLVLLLFHTGLRWSEATALRIRDIDLLDRKLRVVRAWKRTPDNYMVIGEPKSRRSRRTLTISTRLAEALIPLTVDRGLDDLLFVTERGHAVSHSNFRYRVWVPATDAMRAAGVEKSPRLHDARHSHASWLIADKVPLPAIQRRLGHESIQTTIDRYGHLMPDLDLEVAAAMEDWQPDPVDA